jgi:hypothetical protein
MNEAIDRITVPKACRDSIGIKGVCSTTYPYNLDSLGISLSKAAKLADSSKLTAKEFVEEAVEDAWGSVFSDLRVQGFMVQGVKYTYKHEFRTDTTAEASYTDTYTRGCEFEQFFINKVKLKAVGDVTVALTLTYGSTAVTLYSGALSDETLTVTVDSPFPYEEIEFGLTVSGTGELYKANGDSPIAVDGYRECSENLFYCRYHDYLVQAVMYKAAAMILNNAIFNDRYNDVLAFQRNDIAVRIAQLDSSLNVLPNPEKINKYGLYQQEIEKINDKLKQIVKRLYTHSDNYYQDGCGCCFECAEYISTKTVIP